MDTQIPIYEVTFALLASPSTKPSCLGGPHRAMPMINASSLIETALHSSVSWGRNIPLLDQLCGIFCQYPPILLSEESTQCRIFLQEKYNQRPTQVRKTSGQWPSTTCEGRTARQLAIAEKEKTRTAAELISGRGRRGEHEYASSCMSRENGNT